MKKKKFSNHSILFQNRSMLSTFTLLICIVCISIMLVVRMNYLAKEQCYRVLTSSTREACVKIENNFTSDRNSLRILSRVIGLQEHLTSNEVNKLLTAYDVSSITSNIAIVTEENTIIQIRGGNIEDNQIIDFETEKKLGEHISGLQPSITSGQNVLRSFVPIKKSGKIIAMLFLEMNPTAIANAWAPEIYDNMAYFSIIDRETGEIIVSSGSTQNLADMASDELSESIRNGESGFAELDILDDSDDLFISYMPINMENWTIVISVRESEVLASSNDMRHSLWLFLLIDAVSLVLYLSWMVHSTRQSISATEKQANTDILTGLQNRNRYEAFCRKIQDKAKGYACIYIDANGLHEINNAKGHLAGDQMLRFIADTLKIKFGSDDVYRIGGDEFVVFQQKKSEDQLHAEMQKVKEEIERNEYHISAGICLYEAGISLEEMIKTAEKRMYEEKRLYYERLGKQVRNQIEE